MAQIDSQMARYYGLSTDSGVYVASVYDGTGAAEGGLERGDIITAFDGKSVTSPSDLQLMVREKNPGDSVEVTVNRDGQEQPLTVTLGSDENSLTGSSSEQYGYGSGSGSGSGNSGSQSQRGFGF